MSWRDRIQPMKEQQSDDWRSRIAPLAPEPKPIDRQKEYGPVVPIGETALRSFGSAATLDSLDELLAGGRAIMSEGDRQKLYEQFLQEEREKTRTAEEANPLTALVSRLGGYALPGTAALRATKAATMGGRAATEAGLGALQGYGSAETQEQELGSMALGGAFGAGISPATEVAGDVLRAGGRKVGDLFNQVILNTDPKVTQALRADPKALEGALGTKELSQKLASDLMKRQSEIGELSEASLGTLQPVPLQSKSDIITELESLPDVMNLRGTEEYPATQAVLKEIERARNVVANAETQGEVKNVIRALQRQADFQTPDSDAINSARKMISGVLNKNLKAENPDFAESMIPLAEAQSRLKPALKESRVKKEGDELVPTDLTIQQLETLMGALDKDKKSIATQQLEAVSPGLTDALRKQQLLRRSGGGVTQGSRNVNIGLGGTGAAGELVNMATGQTLQPGALISTGVLTGAVIDKYGRSLGSALAKGQGIVGRQILDRFGPMFTRSTNKELTHQFLYQTDPEYKEMFDQINFNNLEQPAHILGSAVLGSDLTRALASTGAGIGSSMAGGSFPEAFGERYQELMDNPVQGEGVASMLSAALPTGKLSKVGKGVVRGVQAIDELLSEEGRTKSAPGMMKIRMPDGKEFPSKIQEPEDFKNAVDGLDLGKGNTMVVTSKPGSEVIEGHIDHPDYPEHTSFSFSKDREGTWTLNSNFRSNEFKNVKELKGTSTKMRQQVAKAVGGIGSDQQNINTRIGIRSYMRDPKALITRPDINDVEGNQSLSKFYTPGTPYQKKKFLKSYQESYPGALNKQEQAAKYEKELQERIERQRLEQEKRQSRINEREAIVETLMTDPRYKDLRESVRQGKIEDVDRYIENLRTGDRESIRASESALTPEFGLPERLRESKERGGSDIEGLREQVVRSQMLERVDPLRRPGMASERAEAQKRLDREENQETIDNYKKIISGENPFQADEGLVSSYSSRDIGTLREQISRAENALKEDKEIAQLLFESGDYDRLSQRMEQVRRNARALDAATRALQDKEEVYRKARETFTPDKSYEELFKAQSKIENSRDIPPIIENIDDVKKEISRLQNESDSRIRQLLGFSKEALKEGDLDPRETAYETIMVKILQEELARRAAQ